MALPLGTDVEYLGANASGGMSVGKTTDELVSFHGVAPVAQASGSAQAALATDALATGAGAYGFSSAQALGVVALLNAIRLALVNKGIIKGS